MNIPLEMSSTKIEDDRVVKTIPVFLSKALADNLFIVQYAMHPNENENSTILKSSIKPGNQEIRLGFTIDTESENYDQNKGTKVAFNIENESLSFREDDKEIFDSDMMDKIMLESLRATPNCTNYAVGIFQENELHITPLKGIVQMRPQFDYLEKSDKRARDETKGEDINENKSNAAPVKVTFARHQPDHLKKMQEQSFQRHSKNSLEEHWIHTTYMLNYDTQFELTQMDTFDKSVEESLNSLNLSSKQYLEHNLQIQQPSENDQQNDPQNDLQNDPQNDSQNDPQNDREQNRTISLNYIKNLKLHNQVTVIMKEARVMSFTNLCANLSSKHDTSNVLKILQQVAVLVQGNWVANSELLYPKNSYSSQSGISAEVICRARDYILLLFREQQYLNRKTISSIVKLPEAEIKEIFEKLSIYKPQKGWQLILPPNSDFCNRYPEIAQRQEMLWEAKRKYLRETMETQCHSLPRQRRKSNRESLGSENEERNIGRGRKSLRDSSLSDNDGTNEQIKSKRTSRSKKVSETATT